MTPSESGEAPQRRRRRKRKLEVRDNKVVFRKRLVHEFELPPEVAQFAKKIEDILDWLVFDSPVASSFRHPHSVRTLVFLLYARAMGTPIAVVAKKLRIAHEQLYRLERLLTRHGIKDQVYQMVSRALKSR
ncbi:MAG: hypothetical protein DRO39_08030 [Thermoprotei archaeon]|nr:MAG: hypothetical protein DRO39_08030 [Thermoprotei archaeon]